MINTYYTYMMTNYTNRVLYTGVTNDLERRVREHKSGLIPGFTQKYHCKKLVYFESFSDVEQAIRREKLIKEYSRDKKNQLVNNSQSRMEGPK
jgi:Predicted endonuclease containing a URI domain